METLAKKNGFFPLMGNSSFDNFFDNFMVKDLFDWTEKNFAELGCNLPSVNLIDTDTNIEVELAAPGMKREDFKVEIDSGMLLISSEKKEEKENLEKENSYIRKEFNYQAFCRTFKLPQTANENKIEANYTDGILHVVIQKKGETKKRMSKNIPIK